jgi:regulator of protease activity HflC (stomatin/prohibitin superfamily)
MSASDKATAIGAIAVCCCCIGLLLTAIFVPLSLHNVEADEIAVRVNTYKNYIEMDTIYKEGRHSLGVNSDFIKYKRNLQTLSYTKKPLNCLSKDGMVMQLSINTQYQIVEENVTQILVEYGPEEEWTLFLDSITRDALKDVCAEFFSEQYFQLRAEIELRMRKKLQEFYQESNAYATNELVQLRNVGHPTEFVKANQDKQNIEQEKERLIAEREEFLTKEQTKQLSAIEDAKIKLIQAHGRAKSIIDKANTLAPAEHAKWTERSDALLNIKEGMHNITTEEFLNGYLKYSILTAQHGRKIVSFSVGEEKNSLLSLLSLDKI